MTEAAIPNQEYYLETPDIETSSDDYATRFSGKVGDWFLKVQRDATLKMLKPYVGASIIDIGGGHGQATRAIIKAGYDLTVFGSDPVCKARISKFVDSGECKFEAGDLLSLPYADNSFDIVLSYRLLPHIDQWHRLIEEMTRVARKAVILDYPEKRSVNVIAPKLFKFKKQMEGNTRPFTLFSRTEVTEQFNKHGYHFTDAYAEFFLPMVLHRKLKQPIISSTMENVCRMLGLTSLFGSPVIVKYTQH